MDNNYEAMFAACAGDEKKIDKLYRALAKKTHRDAGGSDADFVAMHAAKEAALKYAFRPSHEMPAATKATSNDFWKAYWKHNDETHKHTSYRAWSSEQAKSAYDPCKPRYYPEPDQAQQAAYKPQPVVDDAIWDNTMPTECHSPGFGPNPYQADRPGSAWLGPAFVFALAVVILRALGAV